MCTVQYGNGMACMAVALQIAERKKLSEEESSIKQRGLWMHLLAREMDWDRMEEYWKSFFSFIHEKK